MVNKAAMRRVLLTAFLLVGCQAPAPAPVVELPQPPTQKILVHRVSEGDTLYSIAWRYELDFLRLAAVNGLSSPYALFPGQKLSLDMTKTPPVIQPSQPPASSGATARAVAIPEPPSFGTEKPPPKIEIPKVTPLPTGRWSWQWPAAGKVVKEYDAGQKLKGISIYTRQGETVTAAAPGVVVYAGSGLRGYGNLLIVKHSDKYLSAYAHNKSLLVKENDAVAQGQKMAVVGTDASRRDRLYFEIRENGKPVDPLRILPDR
jgi:lipoprotein NlpD